MTLLQHELTDFKVNAFQNNEFHEVTKGDVLGHWSLFFFYPADFTFVCPTELEDLAKNYAKFKEIGCEIYSVSCDTHFVHKAWHDANELLRRVQASQFVHEHGDQVCPANWTPGEETIEPSLDLVGQL